MHSGTMGTPFSRNLSIKERTQETNIGKKCERLDRQKKIPIVRKKGSERGKYGTERTTQDFARKTERFYIILSQQPYFYARL